MIVKATVITVLLILYVLFLSLNDWNKDKYWYVAVFALTGGILLMTASALWLYMLIPNKWLVTPLSVLIGLVGTIYFGKIALTQKIKSTKEKETTLNDIIGKQGTVSYVEPDNQYIGTMDDTSATVLFTCQEPLHEGDRYLITYHDNVHIYSNKIQ